MMRENSPTTSGALRVGHEQPDARPDEATQMLKVRPDLVGADDVAQLVVAALLAVVRWSKTFCDHLAALGTGRARGRRLLAKAAGCLAGRLRFGSVVLGVFGGASGPHEAFFGG